MKNTYDALQIGATWYVKAVIMLVCMRADNRANMWIERLTRNLLTVNRAT